MEDFLFKEKTTGNYYLISSSGRGSSYSIVLQLGTFNKRLISNDYLDNSNNFVSLPLTTESIKLIFSSFRIVDSSISFDDFDNYNYIRLKEKNIRIGNWGDFTNFIARLI